jgi:hypothetical protein
VVNCLLAAPVCHQHLAARRAAQQAQHSGKHGVALWLWCVCVGGGGEWILGCWSVGGWSACVEQNPCTAGGMRSKHKAAAFPQQLVVQCSRLSAH